MENNVKPDFEIKSANQMHGESIIKKLIEEKYLDAKDSKAFMLKLSSGKVKESDWRVEFNATLNLTKS
jgi:hypothetical protein